MLQINIDSHWSSVRYPYTQCRPSSFIHHSLHCEEKSEGIIWNNISREEGCAPRSPWNRIRFDHRRHYCRRRDQKSLDPFLCAGACLHALPNTHTHTNACVKTHKKKTRYTYNNIYKHTNTNTLITQTSEKQTPKHRHTHTSEWGPIQAISKPTNLQSLIISREILLKNAIRILDSSNYFPGEISEQPLRQGWEKSALFLHGKKATFARR